MRISAPLIIAATGVLLGAGTVMLLPERALFVAAEQHEHDSEVNTGERYACPMMDFIGNKPGNCPVCGMKMTKVTAGELTLEQQRRMGVELSTATEGHAAITVHAYGTAEYDNRFTSVIIPRVPGRIVERHVVAGESPEQISVGTPIIDIYSPEAFAAQGELQAAVKLGEQNTIRALRDRFERWNLAAVAETIIRGEPARDTVTVRSPFEGRLLLRDFEAVNEELRVGRELMADSPLLQVVDPNRLALIVQVPEMQARFLREGQPVALASDELGYLPGIEASVGRLGSEISPETRTREVRIYLSDSQGLLSPGSLVSARIKGVLDEALQPADPATPDNWGRFVLVPKTAVLSTGVRNVAWRVARRDNDGRLHFELAPLALGPRLEDEFGNDLYVVRAGLKAGDEVATQGVFLIDSQAQLAGTPSLLFPHGAIAPAGGHQH